MNEDNLQVGRIVFSPHGNTVVAGEGKLSPNPLEYAPRGTLGELKAAKAELAALRKLIKEMEPYMRCTCPYVWSTLKGKLVSPNRQCPVCEIRNRDEVRKILEAK